MEMENELMFEHYLYKCGFTKASVKTYTFQINHIISVYPNAEEFGYKDILNVLEEMVKLKPNATYRIAILASLKKYYDYLIATRKRNDHPCRNIVIKQVRNKSVVHQDFFSSSELELLFQRDERFNDVKVRNQLIVSLLIYQGITSSEVCRIRVQHVNLDEGRIFIKESRDLSRRHLEIHPKQYSLFYRYINEDRKKLLKVDSDQLIIGTRGTPVTPEIVFYLLEQSKTMFPDRNLNPETIRQSVISNWINEKRLPLEAVQLMAGHKWISSTARYRHNNVDEKRILINRFHPIK